MLISNNLHKKSGEVSIKTRSTPASLSFIGQVTKHTTVKWTILCMSEHFIQVCLRVKLSAYNMRQIRIRVTNVFK